ncbi:hypothetical protein D030_0648A, partial [Vibrio parahaemolyticus AQ3810]
MARIMI